MKNTQEPIFWETIEILHNQGVLPYLILIGSWVEYVYQTSVYYEGFRSNFRTMDVDFLIPNLRRPSQKKVNLCSIMERYNYLVQQRLPDGLTKFSKAAGPLEVEFLTKEMGAGQIEPYNVENLGIRVEGLRHLDILSRHTISLVVQSYSITIPVPPAYILHKLIINSKRGYKKTKDLTAIEELLGFIKKSSGDMVVLKDIYNTLTKKEKLMVDTTCQTNFIRLFD